MRAVTVGMIEREGGDGRDVLYLLERLEELIASATRVPFSTRVMVDEQECLDIVDQIRLSLPDEIKQARRLIVERDQILAEAAERADRLVERAEEQVAHRVDDHTIARAAEERAREILSSAAQDADEVRRQADEYAYRLFSRLRARLQQLEGYVDETLGELSPNVDQHEP